MASRQGSTQGKRLGNLCREQTGTDGEYTQSSTQGKQPENLRREQDEWNQVLIQATTQEKEHRNLRREQTGTGQARQGEQTGLDARKRVRKLASRAGRESSEGQLEGHGGMTDRTT